jgi:hypothetical protein
MANSSGHFFFVWTLIAIGVIGLFSAILAARALWNPQWGQSRLGYPIRRGSEGGIQD